MIEFRVGRKLKLRTILAALVFVSAGITALTVSVPKASAGICYLTYSCDTGWFTGRGPDSTGEEPSDWWDVLDGGIHSANLGQFTSDIAGHLKCVNPGTPGATLGVAQNDNNATGAAFIVLTMLGAPMKTPKNQACVRWNQWVSIVTQYDKAGLVDYNLNLNPVNANTFFTHSWGGDIGFDKAAAPGPAIVFYLPDHSGIAYAIRHECGNPVGVIKGLPPLAQPPTGDVNPPTPQNGSNPPGYTAGDASVNSSCQTISGHAFDPNAPNFAVPVTVTYSIAGAGTSTGNASISGAHLYSINTPAAVRNSTSQVTVTVTAKASDSSAITMTNSPIKIGPCLLPQGLCEGITSTPSSIDPSTQFSVTARVNYNDAAIRAAVLASGAKFFISVKGQGYNQTNSNVQPITTYPVGGLSATAQFGPTNKTGLFNVGYGISGPFGSVNCGDAIANNPNPPTIAVTGKPYFEVDGGDISAGAGMSVGGSDCSNAVAPNPKAGIVSWNQGSTGSYGGAGTQYAALALGHLQDFATGQGSSMTPSGLSFANNADGQVNAAGGLFGGNFGGTACTADYFANATNVQTGNITVGGQAVPNGVHKTIYVDGNVYITGNITFSGSYANATEVPSFAIVVRGNIYVAPGVTQLDGFYIAQPSSKTATNGVIYTCASGAFTAAPLDRNLQATCNNSLTVNGAFTGRQVWLLRTAGSLTSTPAEKFNYSPELWLSAPFGNGLGGDTGDYDSITSLPPVL